MGALNNVGLFLGGVLGTAIVGFVTRDAYACLPQFQEWLIRIAARRLPEKLREQYIEQWSADILDLPPSQLFRTFMAADCIRGALAIAHHARRMEARHPRWLLYFANFCFLVRTRVTEVQSLIIRLRLSITRLVRGNRKRTTSAAESSFRNVVYILQDPSRFGSPCRFFLDDWRDNYVLEAIKADDRAATATDEQVREKFRAQAEVAREMARFYERLGRKAVAQ